MSDETPSFSIILDEIASDAERPKPIPVGTYIGVVVGQPRFDKFKTGTDYVGFSIKPLEALDDVDLDALEEMGGLNSKVIPYNMPMTHDSKYRITEFLSHCGIDVEGRTYSQCIAETPNCQVKVHIVHRGSQDGTTAFANIDRTAPVE